MSLQFSYIVLSPTIQTSETAETNVHVKGEKMKKSIDFFAVFTPKQPFWSPFQPLVSYASLRLNMAQLMASYGILWVHMCPYGSL